jgi:hypothetical protein
MPKVSRMYKDKSDSADKVKINMGELRDARDLLSRIEGGAAYIAVALIDIEIKRRSKAGRKKTSPDDRTEQNRKAQRRRRNRLQVENAIARHRSRWPRKPHDVPNRKKRY